MNRVIEKIRGYGHQDNPAIRALFTHYTEADWEKLRPSYPDGKALVHSFQQMMSGDLASICAKEGIQYQGGDGFVGPATKKLLKVQRCGCPDYLPQETEEATGSGSIPSGCYPDILPENHVTKIYFDLSGASAKVKSWWAEIWAVVKEAYREIGLLIVETDDLSKANHHFLFDNLGGNTIGLAIVNTSWQCSDRVWLKIDRSYYPSAIRVAQVLAHEFAHNTGVGHINGDPIQNPSVVNQDWNGSFRGTPLGNIFESMFGGEPVPTPDDPSNPPIPPATRTLWFDCSEENSL